MSIVDAFNVPHFSLTLTRDRPDLDLKAGDAVVADAAPGWGPDGLHVVRWFNRDAPDSFALDRVVTTTRRGTPRRRIRVGEFLCGPEPEIPDAYSVHPITAVCRWV